jgi:F-type H+-transporting ATPase subunit b
MSLDPLAQISVITITGVILIFLVMSFLLRRLVFLPLIEVMERRRTRIATSLARQAEAQAELDQARRQAEESGSRARARTEQIVNRIRQETAERCQARVADATREAEAILEHGREEMQTVRRAEEARLTEELIACVTSTLGRIAGAADEDAVHYLVQQVLTQQKAG